MNRSDVFRKVKRATVAMAVWHDGNGEQPYTIIGSGFCIHPRGVIVSCRHVLTAFFTKNFDALIAAIPEEDKKKELQPLKDLERIRPHALFFITDWSQHELVVIPVPVETVMVKLDTDLGLLRIAVHKAAEKGYPVLEFEDFGEIHEGMELGTCGFPLGNFMQEQIGTVTSSFTRGSLSSIIPSPGAGKEHVKGFQLDLTATYGNSGGPVFSLESGKVFGVLQGGVTSQMGKLVPGFTKAESVYPLMEDRIMSDILTLTEEEMKRRMGS